MVPSPLTNAAQNDSPDSPETPPRRAPVSGTMARVMPAALPAAVPAAVPAALPAAVPAAPESLDENYGLPEEETRISSPLRILHASDEEATGIYEDMPTRVMHPPEDVLDAPPSSRRPATLPPARGEMHSDTAISMPLATPTPSVVIAEDRAAPALPSATPAPLERERALLRALTAPRLTMPPVVAIRSAPPSLRMLAIVAGFTTLGLMWVMAVCAMVLVLVTR